MKRTLFGFFFLLAWNSSIQAQTNFDQGKTVTLITGTTAGSQYDTVARLIAQHWGKHIPGNPGFIVQNMAGAGSMITANYLYNVAKPDGLTIGSVIPAIYFNQLAGRKEVRFEHEELPNGRLLIHNYGHGGAGFTLCWGCADEICTLLA